MMDNVLPEERLLRLIKGHAKEPGRSSDAGIEPLNPHAGKAKPAFEKERSLLQRYLYIFNGRNMMLAGYVVSCAYLIFSFIHSPATETNGGLSISLQETAGFSPRSFIYPEVSSSKMDLSSIAPEKALEAQSEPALEIKPLSFYLESVSGRKIFGNAAQPEIQKNVNAQSSDVIKEINLVGIITGDHPQAIIEDKSSQKTFYINKGQFIGEFQVEDIQEGKITVNHEGERYELYL